MYKYINSVANTNCELTSLFVFAELKNFRTKCEGATCKHIACPNCPFSSMILH